MAILEIPVRATPNQSFQVLLEGQNCTIRLYSRAIEDIEHLFMDLAIDQTVIFAGVICQDMERLKLYPIWPFSGQLVFVDMNGDDEPEWSGLGERWKLLYLTKEDEHLIYN